VTAPPRELLPAAEDRIVTASLLRLPVHVLLREPGDAGCPTGACPHPTTAHEAEDYAANAAPIRPICTVQVGGKPCPCGEQWRNT
jgi:hypothetical protein